MERKGFRKVDWGLVWGRFLGRITHRTSFFIFLDPLFVRVAMYMDYSTYVWRMSRLDKEPFWAIYIYLLSCWSSVMYLVGFFFFLDWMTLTFGLSESSVSALLYFLIFLFVLPAKNFLVKGTSTFFYFLLIWKYFYQLRSGIAFQEQLLILLFTVAVLRPLWNLAVEFCFFQLIKNLVAYHWFRRILSKLNPNMSLQELQHWYEVTRGQSDQGG